MTKIKTLLLLVSATLLFDGCSTRLGEDGVSPSTTQNQQRQTIQNDSYMAEEIMVESGTVETIDGFGDIEVTENSVEHDGVNHQNEQGFESVFFKYDSFQIDPEMHKYLTFNLTKIREEYPNRTIILEGNCDEWGSDEYNQALGLKRAYAIKKYLMAEGFSEDKISLKSYGELNNVCNVKTQECWAKNRRVDFVAK